MQPDSEIDQLQSSVADYTIAAVIELKTLCILYWERQSWQTPFQTTALSSTHLMYKHLQIAQMMDITSTLLL